MQSLVYPRHFLLLAAFTVFIGWLSRSPYVLDLATTFSLYGALHAAALVLALHERRPAWHRCLLIAVAAGLSVMAVHVGIAGRPLAARLPGSLGTYALLGFTAALGAMAYGIAIRLLGIYRLTPGGIAKISMGCALAAFAALFTTRVCRFLGVWWLAALWWYAFSGGLWYCDRRRLGSRP